MIVAVTLNMQYQTHLVFGIVSAKYEFALG